MATKSKSKSRRPGPSSGRVTAKGSSGEGAAPGSGRTGSAKAAKPRGPKSSPYLSPEESGRYTAPIPRNVKKSPRWVGILVLAMMIVGMLLILLKYLNVLGGTASVGYVIAGIVLVFAGFLGATRFR